MSYKKAADVLPEAIINLIQDYVDGEYLYIPRKEINRKAWGENTNRKKETEGRNREIYRRYREGVPVSRLSQDYYLSPKSIQKIVARCRDNST
nr:CD3324 family protein [uncultured Eisenbergiella sp.]